jgi:hypothetical protein
VVQTFATDATKRSGTLRGSCGENCIPNFGRSFAIDSELSKFELTFPGSVSLLVQIDLIRRNHPGAEQFDAGAAIHCPLDRFQSIDLTLRLPMKAAKSLG